MKYSYLAAWVEQYSEFSAQIESVRLADDCFILSFKNNQAWKIVLSARDSYLYLSNGVQDSDAGVELWTQLRGSKMKGCSIHPMDRILEIYLEHKDIYGDVKQFVLVCELMPPKPNVILCKKQGLIVQDALHKYSLADNPMRMVQANQAYFPPRTSFKPESQAVICIPKVEDVHPVSLNHYFQLLHQVRAHSLDENTLLKGKISLLKREQKKLQKRLGLQLQDLANAEKMDYFRSCAEAIKPNLSKIQPGQSELIATDYFSEDLAEITIPLLADKSPQQNLNYYIKKYQKAKNGLAIIRLNIAKTEKELDSVKNLIQRLQAGEDIDLDNRDSSHVIHQKVQQLERILNLRVGEGWHIYIGRKAKENDFITTKLGKPQDWWFHSRIYRGAHVLLRNYKKQEPQAELINLCSSLAAWYSQAKFSVNVPVDYTQIRYVRKPRGSAAGFVTYTNYKTCFANPMDIRQVRSELKL
ncbi:MAG: NFACT RNA binding domain-containing protein [Candidatus Cloacimonetes bacterium]|nr:NFACT RNA binding domain-containing protein [Candidatus Cloacimonadota bacterium]